MAEKVVRKERGNLHYFDMARAVPDDMKKPITDGRQKGLTAINNMWRIEKLTEMFGPCGIGWYTEIVNTWNEEGKNGDLVKFCEIKLFIRSDGCWSEAIPGVGGAMFCSLHGNIYVTSDEALKAAYTDALSVSCKALGIGADVYLERDETKYPTGEEKPKGSSGDVICKECGQKLQAEIHTLNGKFTAAAYIEESGGLCPECHIRAIARVKNSGGKK